MEVCVRSSPYFFSLAVHRAQYTQLIIVVVVCSLLLVDVSIEGLITLTSLTMPKVKLRQVCQ